MTPALHRRAVPVVALIAALIAGCGPPLPPPNNQSSNAIRDLTPSFEGAVRLPPPEMGGDGPGSLVTVSRFDGNAELDEVDATAFRVVYRSTSETGEPTQVSGLVAIPPGPPPRVAGRWCRSGTEPPVC